VNVRPGQSEQDRGLSFARELSDGHVEPWFHPGHLTDALSGCRLPEFEDGGHRISGDTETEEGYFASSG